MNVERMFRKPQAYLASIFASAMDAIIILDEDQRIMLLNKAAEDTFGLPADQLVGTSVQQLLPERFRQTHQAYIDRFGKTGVTNRKMGRLGTLVGLRTNGEEFPLEATISQVEEGGKKIYTVIIRDITERMNAEKLIQQNAGEIAMMTQQLWQAAKLATMGELAASIAHELNNPLTILNLRVESLLSQASESEPGYRELRIMEGEIDRMTSLVANLLQFSRSSERQFSTLQIQDEIEHSLELLLNHFTHRGIAIRRDYDPGCPLIQADRQQLRQLFLNLFSNSCDAMPEGGLLTIRTSFMEHPLRVRVEVEDTGVGILPEHLDRVIDPFYTTKPEGQGTGLGLAICRRIIEEHHGSFQISSPGENQGTRIELAFPA